MNEQLIITAIYSGLFLTLFAVGEMLYHVFKLKAESTRKIIHVFTGLICFSFPLFITSHWSVLFLTISFALILSLSIRFKLLKSINAIDRKTSGSILFPISIYIMFWAYSYFGHNNLSGNGLTWESAKNLKGIFSDTKGIYYFLPLLIFSISDPLAALFGKKWPHGKYTLNAETKTMVGTFAFFTSATAISFLFLVYQIHSLQTALFMSLILGFGTAVTEGLSQKGFDNLFIPTSAIVILVLFQ